MKKNFLIFIPESYLQRFGEAVKPKKNCLSVFDHFVWIALKGLIQYEDGGTNVFSIYFKLQTLLNVILNLLRIYQFSTKKRKIQIFKKQFYLVTRYQKTSVLRHFSMTNYISLEEAYSEPCQRSLMQYFKKIVNSFQKLIVFAKHSILDVLQVHEYPSGLRNQLACFSLNVLSL